MKIGQIFPVSQFDKMREEGYVRVQQHPTLSLSIANYTEKAQYEQVWNAVTLNCRGLIFHKEGTVLARPYAKFFNFGDMANTGNLDVLAPATVVDKLDGSLGICYPTPDGPAIATRGSFTSDQALHATELLRTRYKEWEPGTPSFTWLFEIVYPANRIVIDYGATDDLILHGTVDITTGVAHPVNRLTRALWPGPAARVFDYENLASAVAAQPRPNAEGFVVHVGNKMIKIKQEDYVALHRIITGLNARTVWEWLGAGKTVGDLCATLPDDFHGWVEDLANELTDAADNLIGQAKDTLTGITLHVGAISSDNFTRAEFAAYAKQHPELAPYLFLLLDGNGDKARELAWRSVKPSGTRSLINHTEAVA